MSRRPLFRAVLVGLATALTLAACGTGDADDASGDAWSYVSGDGKTYTADEVPTRIIAQAEVAAGLIQYGIRPVGIFLNDTVENTKTLKGLDLSGIEILGETWGQIDAEKAAELKPDLIATTYWPVEEAYGGLENGVEEDSKKIAKLAPVVGPTAGESVIDLLEGIEDLAASLGVDVDDSPVAADKEAFEQAKERFSSVVAAQEGLTALAVSPTEELLYVAVPEHAAELTDFAEWGLDVIVPDSPDPTFPYWENLSWETADKYQADVILLDDRTYDASLKAAEAQPTWKQLKAVEAGAVIAWPAFWITTYSSYAEQLDLLSDALEKADPNLT